MCPKCVTLHAIASRYCDEGWQIAKEYRRADAIVSNLAPSPPEGQPALF